jgi:hypothetical protein
MKNNPYNKFIFYGDTFELYEYERSPRPMAGRGGRKRKASVGDADNESDRQDSPTAIQERRRKREDNAWRAKLAFTRLVGANLSESEPPLLITITYKENVSDIAIGYKDFRAFVQALRYKYGNSFKYICTPEFQRRGSVHFHALFWGLPTEVYVQERRTRTIAKIWGHGFLDLMKTDGDQALSGYLAKYMTKTFTDPRLKNKKAYVASRNINRPISGKGFSPVWPVIEEYVGDAQPVSDKQYSTPWLGKCRRRIFKRSKE